LNLAYPKMIGETNTNKCDSLLLLAYCEWRLYSSPVCDSRMIKPLTHSIIVSIYQHDSTLLLFFFYIFPDKALPANFACGLHDLPEELDFTKNNWLQSLDEANRSLRVPQLWNYWKYSYCPNFYSTLHWYSVIRKMLTKQRRRKVQNGASMFYNILWRGHYRWHHSYFLSSA
jgi:hypothetical protein